MIEAVDQLVEDYYSWMRMQTLTHLETSSGWGLISTPFIGLNNDHISISVKEEGNSILLSDEGDTLANLKLEGVKFDNRSKTRLKYKNDILRNFGVEINAHDELIVKCKKNEFPQYAHNFIQAIKELSDLSVLSSKSVAKIFNDDVRSYFDDLNIVYTEEIFLKSADGLNIKYDFIVPQRQTDFLVRSFSRVNESHIKGFFYDSDSVMESRRKEGIALAIINDSQIKPNPSLLEAIGNRTNTKFLLWSERLNENSKQLLVA